MPSPDFLPPRRSPPPRHKPPDAWWLATGFIVAAWIVGAIALIVVSQ
ncbi:MAG: hypothetical protein JNL81_11485 [Hyphomonadaceae bacterium]|nr:hypothetical protein [Hyphomonadaceae bacterium]